MPRSPLALVLCTVVLLLGAQAALSQLSAQAAPVPNANAPLKVGVADLSRIIDKSPQSEQARLAMEHALKPHEKQVSDARKALEREMEALDTQRPKLSDAEIKRREAELDKHTREFKEAEERYRQDFNAERNQVMAALQKSITAAIRALASEEHFDLILTDGVAFADPRIDVTAKLLARMQSIPAQ